MPRSAYGRCQDAFENLVAATWPDAGKIMRLEQEAFINLRDKIVAGQITLPVVVTSLSAPTDAPEYGSDAYPSRRAQAVAFLLRSVHVDLSEAVDGDKRVTTVLEEIAGLLALAIWQAPTPDFRTYAFPSVDVTVYNLSNAALAKNADPFAAVSVTAELIYSEP